MEQVEDYFIDEEKIKLTIAGNHQVKKQKMPESDKIHETPKSTLNASAQTKEKENSIKTHSKNKGKPSLNSLFVGSVHNVRTYSRISIPSDISSRLKRVALYMEQAGMPHSVNAYINNVLLQHLKEYENEINQLENDLL